MRTNISIIKQAKSKEDFFSLLWGSMDIAEDESKRDVVLRIMQKLLQLPESNVTTTEKEYIIEARRIFSEGKEYIKPKVVVNVTELETDALTIACIDEYIFYVYPKGDPEIIEYVIVLDKNARQASSAFLSTRHECIDDLLKECEKNSADTSGV